VINPFMPDEEPVDLPGASPVDPPIDVPGDLPREVPTDPHVPVPSDVPFDPPGDLPSSDDTESLPMHRPPVEPNELPESPVPAE
jgi:hypothetical protein